MGEGDSFTIVKGGGGSTAIFKNISCCSVPMIFDRSLITVGIQDLTPWEVHIRDARGMDESGARGQEGCVEGPKVAESIFEAKIGSWKKNGSISECSPIKVS